MSSAAPSHRTFIKKLGGPTALARDLGHSTEAVKQWGQSDRSIPWRWRHQVKQLADQKRVRVPADFLHVEGAA